jgi:hypothetical protein
MTDAHSVFTGILATKQVAVPAKAHRRARLYRYDFGRLRRHLRPHSYSPSETLS